MLIVLAILWMLVVTRLLMTPLSTIAVSTQFLILILKNAVAGWLLTYPNIPAALEALPQT